MIVDLSSGLSRSLRAAHHGWVADLEPVLAAENVSADQWLILDAMRDGSAGITMTELARRAAMPASSATRHIDALAQRGLVFRAPGAPDRRRILVSLSPRGIELADRLAAREAGHVERLRDALGPEVFDAVMAALEVVAGDEEFAREARRLTSR